MMPEPKADSNAAIRDISWKKISFGCGIRHKHRYKGRKMRIMAFWIFMVVSNFLIPVLMIIFGRVFLKHPPKTINSIYGYRTTMSSKNQETWDFAHQYCGKLWWKLGWIMFVISIFVMLPVLGKDTETVGAWGSVFEILEGAVLLISIFPTEKALRRNFDKEGNRRME